MSAADRSAYLDEAEAAEFLRISKRTLARRRLADQGPRYRKHGVAVLYTVEDLRAWSDRTAFQSTTNERLRKEGPVTGKGATA